MPTSVQEIAARTGYSTKTVSSALHGGSARMAESTRAEIHAAAQEMGYVTNFAARAMRQGWIPLLGIIADELITTPFATEIIRGLDRAARRKEISVFATNFGSGQTLENALQDLQRFRPRAIGYAAMFNKVVSLPDSAIGAVGVLINCRDAGGRVPSIVPDDEAAAYDITRLLIERGRRKLAFLNLPGILAGRLREKGFRAAAQDGGLAPEDLRIMPAVKGEHYRELAHSLVPGHVEDLCRGAYRPDAILAGNDRVAMEIYAALRREGFRIPDDIAVASFDNQVDIARRLDPPLTTMALPHRRMGNLAASILLGDDVPSDPITKVRFRLVSRNSV